MSLNNNLSSRQRETNKHATEMDELRTSNRTLSSQVLVLLAILAEASVDISISKLLENSLAQLSSEHVEILVGLFLYILY